MRRGTLEEAEEVADEEEEAVDVEAEEEDTLVVEAVVVAVREKEKLSKSLRGSRMTL